MRISHFWDNMTATFGRAYAESVATDQTLPQLDGRTVKDALAEGWDVKAVWMAVCEAYGERVPRGIRR
ncbi:MAG TPA: DUF3046 domain-containing protein [Stackebrandtia sp.]|uniref:DUF3046 domain-containing protein n=1 Tax=Stackebrandtia sp. TaxID=2023065 RepID=UPI002D35754A|nr:DUF3046 domain-containing protein [Stackebrandtia sp.]HZE39869.1 DUF3046 domain-containing protein [Stackebrandtia sp.]